MPIVVHLDRLLYERGLTLTELSRRIGLTIANLSILKTGKAKAIRFSTLEVLCRELQCQPGDLLAHVDVEPSQPTGEGPHGGVLTVPADTDLEPEG
ncbi:MAG: helix-turn-helix transcriptional regulator [Solirubrobacterales bacterium]|nr:helix-turn-helix transcriptional regulator [Solirubrobacterales bacterium]